MGACLVHLSNSNGASMTEEEWERERDKGDPDGEAPCIMKKPLEAGVNIISLQKEEAWNKVNSKEEGRWEEKKEKIH